MSFRKLLDFTVAFIHRSGIYIERALPTPGIVNWSQSIAPKSTNLELIGIGSLDGGGYLFLNDIEGIQAVFSPGVGEKSQFEKVFAGTGVPFFG